MSNIKVAVVRGGPSAEYDVSLNSGKEVLHHLPDKYEAKDIIISKNGEWLSSGVIYDPQKLLKDVDVVFNAMHGEFGEDGQAQQIFDTYEVPYTGSTMIPSSLAMQKHKARPIFLTERIKVPHALIFTQDSFIGEDPEYVATEVFKKIPPLWVTKPASRGSSIGVSICRSFPELVEGIEKAFEYDNTIVVEEFIDGREATCGVLEDYRFQKHYPLPPIEIIPPENAFFNYENKYDGSTKEICPANFDDRTKREIEYLAKRAHQALGCRHYSRSDFIVSPKRGVYLLETNTLPGLTSESLLPKSAKAAGLEFPDLLNHLIQLALKK